MRFMCYEDKASGWHAQLSVKFLRSNKINRQNKGLTMPVTFILLPQLLHKPFKQPSLFSQLDIKRKK